MADTPQIIVAKFRAAAGRAAGFSRRLALWAFAGSEPEIKSRKAVEPRRLSLADQWVHVTDIVAGAASRAQEAARCHASATQQLDLAQYALASLVDELAAVMDMNGRVRRRATIHVLGTAPMAPVRQIGEAIAA